MFINSNIAIRLLVAAILANESIKYSVIEIKEEISINISFEELSSSELLTIHSD